MIGIGIRLKKIRIARGLSYAKLAKLSGVSKSHIWNIENNEKDVNLTTVKKLSNGLNVTQDYLLEDYLHLKNRVRKSKAEKRKAKKRFDICVGFILLDCAEIEWFELSSDRWICIGYSYRKAITIVDEEDVILEIKIWLEENGIKDAVKVKESYMKGN